ncbi:MAG: alpha/beta fold hydrolase [Gammaproteobacteria bacterium]|nr:MAG: alpha/beta fold hydrolase [Gammaproteobacteria bacterium]
MAVDDSAGAFSTGMRAIRQCVVLGGVALLVLLGVLSAYTVVTMRDVARQLPPPGIFIDVEGARMHYVDQGRGPVVVLIHGLGGSSRNFSPIADELAHSHRVIAIDRPGSGYSSRPPARSRALADQASVIATLLDQLDIESAIVVGHSLGGAVALALALDHPRTVSRLVLLAPATTPVELEAPLDSPMLERRWFQQLLAWTIAVPASRHFADDTLARVFQPQPVPEDFATTDGGLLARRPGQILSTIGDLLALNAGLEHYRSRYAQLGVPVRVIYGKEDAILEPEVHLGALQNVPMVSIERLPGVGHMVAHARPERVLALIKGVMAQPGES